MVSATSYHAEEGGRGAGTLLSTNTAAAESTTPLHVADPGSPEHGKSSRPHVAGWAELGTAAGHDTSPGGFYGDAAVYEWRGEYGDIGPSVPQLEDQLFGGDHVMRQGDHVENLQLEVTVEGPVKVTPIREVGLPSQRFRSFNACH